MNKDIFEGKYTQYKGMILKTWGKLTRDDVDVAEGTEEILIGRLQERYGWARDEARNRVTDEFAKWEKPARH